MTKTPLHKKTLFCQVVIEHVYHGHFLNGA